MIVVGVSMIIGFWFYQRFNPEIFMGQEGEVIGQQEINANPTGNYAGKTVFRGFNPEPEKKADDLEPYFGAQSGSARYFAG